MLNSLQINLGRVFNLLNTRANIAAVFLAVLMLAPAARAVEVLTVHELVSHCKLMDAKPEGADAQYCIRYLQGFIDGAVATDVSVMLNAEAGKNREETFTERAMRTRMPSRADKLRAAELAGFCLGDPLPMRAVVKQVVADLVKLDVGATASSPAREAVYKSLREHYSCGNE
ncbi:hypothetical protein SAMN02745866_00714 [Alteromonadaceae bacterium Bs31]|nr:hypothetical protein SAMN02745866_00714 [Alteromonadaceae bacterium Bs31]